MKFKKGNVPYNKGMKRGSVSPQTEFKPGVHATNFKGYGNPNIVGKRKEVITTIEDQIEHVARGKKYMTRKRTSYARYLWTNINGTIPKGYIVYNKGTNLIPHINDLILLSRTELLKLNLQNKC